MVMVEFTVPERVFYYYSVGPPPTHPPQAPQSSRLLTAQTKLITVYYCRIKITKAKKKQCEYMFYPLNNVQTVFMRTVKHKLPPAVGQFDLGGGTLQLLAQMLILTTVFMSQIFPTQD